MLKAEKQAVNGCRKKSKILVSMQNTVIILVLIANGTFQYEHSVLDRPVFLGPFRAIRKIFYTNLRQYSNSREARQRLIAENRLQPDFSNHTFPCDITNGRSSIRPASVHHLRPGDIDVVGAIGDSLTAGFGLKATNIIGFINEHRGGSFILGGEKTWRQFLTIPNLLKEFNKNLVGYSYRDSLTIEYESQFNVAEGGAISNNIPYMSTILIKRIISDKRVDVNSDWKLISINIGSNDLCGDVCYRKDPFSSIQSHVNELKYVLRTLKKYLPRTLVYLIPTPDVYQILTSLTNKPPICQIMHKIECSCIFNNNRIIAVNTMIKLIKEWRQSELDIEEDPEFDTEDFTVVVQPFSLNFTFPYKNGLPDLSYMSTDCFHVSQKGNALLAVSLWNNLLEPVGSKTMGPAELMSVIKMHCPSEEKPYIFTRRNS